MTTRIRTWILIAGLTALFISLGALVGGAQGLVLFLFIAVIFNFAMFWFSDRLALRMSGAKPVTEEEAPQLYADVRELVE